MQRGNKTRKSTIAKHSGFRPPDLASVVLHFEYEIHDAPKYQISGEIEQSATELLLFVYVKFERRPPSWT